MYSQLRMLNGTTVYYGTGLVRSVAGSILVNLRIGQCVALKR